MCHPVVNNFRYSDVAKIVAETMNNYLMFEKLLKCKVVPNGISFFFLSFQMGIQIHAVEVQVSNSLKPETFENQTF